MPDRDKVGSINLHVRRVAVVVPQQGPSGIFGPSCEAAARLAAAEVNAGQGILGKPLELVFIDGGESPPMVAASLREAIDDGVDAVTGWHISSVRRAIVPLLAGTIPYVYPALYEGGERSDGVICTGEVPLAQIRPAMSWLRDELGVRRWFIAGNDYLWPRLTAASTVRFAHQEGLSIQGTRLVDMPSPAEQMSDLLDAVERSDCQGVLMLFPGLDGVEFNRQFAERELDRQVLRFSPLMEENMLMASGPEATRGIFSAAGYFRSLVSTSALDFQGRYAEAFGSEAPALNTVAESTYSALHVVASLAQLAGGMAVSQLAAALDGAVVEVPRGRLTFAGHAATQSVYLAEARGCDFEIVTRLHGAGERQI
ncbi:MAG: substrate-binding domain-containing protein [Actinomycetota bacterium]|nr:substrate-binding domain-containing protein [Actinomycetota bacterium]